MVKIVGDVSKYSDNYFRWYIPDFFSLSQADSAHFWSPDFEHEDATWCIEISPSNAKMQQTHLNFGSCSEWISMYLIKKMSACLKHVVIFRMHVTDKYERLHEIKESGIVEYVGNGAKREPMLLNRSKLLRDRSKVAPINVLTVNLGVFIMDKLKGANESTPEGETSKNEITRKKRKKDNDDESNTHRHPKGTSKNTSEEETSKNEMSRKKRKKRKKDKFDQSNIQRNLKDTNKNTAEGETSKNEKKRKKTKKKKKGEVGVDTLLNDFESLFLSKEDSDVTLKVEDQEFQAHKLILGARSHVFRSMFKHNLVETSSGVVDITDCDPETFQYFLIYLYSASFKNTDQSKVLNLFMIADKYDVQDLRTECIEVMKKTISVKTFCDVVILALLHNEAPLLQICTEFFTENMKVIIETVQWQSFAKENATASNELLIKALRCYSLDKKSFGKSLTSN